MWGQSCQERQLESPQNTLIHLPEWFRSNLNTHSSSRPGNTPGVTSGVFSPIPHAVCSRGLPVAVGLSPGGGGCRTDVAHCITHPRGRKRRRSWEAVSPPGIREHEVHGDELLGLGAFPSSSRNPLWGTPSGPRCSSPPCPQLCCSGVGGGAREVSREKGVNRSSPQDKRGEEKRRLRDPLTCRTP